MTAATSARLDAIRNRSTKYEIVLAAPATADAPARELLLAYAPKSQAAMIRAIQNRGAELVAFTGAANMFRGETKNTLKVGAWIVRYTGRTQREAILTGERQYFASVEGGR